MAEFWGYIDSNKKIVIRPLNEETLEQELDELHTKHQPEMLIIATPFQAESKIVAFNKIMETLLCATQHELLVR